MDYRLITAGNMGDLEQQVTAHLLNGWQLQGGVAATSIVGIAGPVTYLFQAMVKMPGRSQ